ncbi:MAG: DMT family transporter [Proteobacteria bacterium]|nr:DMT family transporter [Pseudomonadota bacterium]
MNHTAARHRFAIPFGGLVLGAIFMGCSPIFVRMTDVGPFSSAFWRVALALPPLWFWQRLAREPAVTNRSAFLKAAAFAGVAFAGDLMFWHLSILNTTIANATLLSTMAPVWVFLAAFAWFGQRLRGVEVIGLAICLLGGALLIRDSFEIDRTRLVGDLQGVATSLFFGLYIVGINEARKYGGPARITFLSTAITAVLLLGVAITSGEQVLPGRLAGWIPLFGLALVSQAAGQGLLAYALGKLPVAFSSLVVFLEALAAAALGWLVFSERLGLWQWLGGCLVLFGIWLARPTVAEAVPDGSDSGN